MWREKKVFQVKFIFPGLFAMCVWKKHTKKVKYYKKEPNEHITEKRVNEPKFCQTCSWKQGWVEYLLESIDSKMLENFEVLDMTRQ